MERKMEKEVVLGEVSENLEPSLRIAWERPALRRLDASEAQMQTGIGTQGSGDKS